jgi:hypothetical protein
MPTKEKNKFGKSKYLSPNYLQVNFFFSDLRGKNINESIVLKPSLAGRLGIWSTRSRVGKKIGEGKTRQDPVKNPIATR